MSIHVTSWVWENTKAEGAELLVLLSLADHAANDGSCYPSMRRIAERARLSLRGAQTAMRALEGKGAIKTCRNTGPKGCNRYTLMPVARLPQFAFRRRPDVKTQIPCGNDKTKGGVR